MKISNQVYPLQQEKKIVQKHGSHYQSQRLNEINPGYGPMPQSSDDETKKFSFMWFFQTTSQVHDYVFEVSEGNGRKYYHALERTGINNGQNFLQELENGSIRVVDKRKDKEEINFESKKTESVKKSLREVIKEFEEKGECHKGGGETYCA